MADTTTHDTVGASTLATPLFMASSPPPRDHDHTRSISPVSDRVAPTPDRRIQKDSTTPRSSRAASPDGAPNALDARLAEYTVDFNQFPSGHVGADEEPLPDLNLPDDDDLSDVGGPEDFTANLEKYLMGDDDTFEHKPFEDDLLDDEQEIEHEHEQEEDDEDEEEEELPQEQKVVREQEQERHAKKPESRQQSSSILQPIVEDEAELGEYSEFGPPVDMSTPSHFLRRPNGLTKDETHLEDIEEDPDDGPDEANTPSVRKHRSTSSKDQSAENEELRRQVEALKKAVQDRDEQLEENHRRMLEAASSGEQIKHLQAELERTSDRLDELHAKGSDEADLREQIQLLRRQNEEKESLLQNASASDSGLSALQKQVGDMQKELQNRGSHADLDAERLETIANLREQLSLAQEQLKKQDATLDATLAKLKETTSAKEQQVGEKNAEIHSLKAQLDDQVAENEKLEAEIERANREYQTLEERIASLETRNRPLEEKNSTLEADLTRAQSQVTAQENALKAMAADLPLETGENTYTEILELIKDLGQPTTTRPGDIPMSGKDINEHEFEQFREEFVRMQADLKESNSARQTLDAQLARCQEQAAEAQALIKSIEDENTRLSKRADELKSTVDNVQKDLRELKDEHTEALDTIDRLQEKNRQQPSPPPSPPAPRKDLVALEESHQAQLKSLQSAHNTAISTLRASHSDSSRRLRELLSAAEKRESKLKTELASLRSSRSDESEISVLRKEIQRLESVIAVKDETAATMDQRIARSVDKREKEWERRVDLLLKERERMSRVLMWTWGEKEMGEDKDNVDEHGRRKQVYRYKHAKPSGRKA